MTAAAPQLTRSQVVARAASWYNIGLDYDWDSTYQGYRKDCSGYVSMAWQLATPVSTPRVLSRTVPSPGSPRPTSRPATRC